MKRVWTVFLSVLLCLAMSVSGVRASGVFGVHILAPQELDAVLAHRGNQEQFFVTVPYSIYDRREEVWQEFFTKAREARVTPLIRLTTRFENGSWIRPSRKDLVEAAAFLRTLNWEAPRHIILFNEPNHAGEWGGAVDPEDYANRAVFAASWFGTEPMEYVVLPAGLDGASNTSGNTMESFLFMDRVLAEQPEFLTYFDGWTSHSYPNPGFVGSAYATGKQSIRGFEAELAYLESKGVVDLPVYITETGWRQTAGTVGKLPSYYAYAAKHVWNDPRVRAVTVFLWQASEGPFIEFSMLHPDGSPTPQFLALHKLFF